MFRIISLIAIPAMLFWAYRQQGKAYFSEKPKAIWQDFWQGLKTLTSDWKNYSKMRNWCYSLLGVSTFLLAISGFAELLALGHHASGFLLLLHLLVSPLFILAISGLAALWFHQNQLAEKEWRALRSSDKRVKKTRQSGWRKLHFWALMFCALFVIVSILLSMYPLFGTSGQNFMLNIHRYTSLFFLLLVVWPLKSG